MPLHFSHVSSALIAAMVGFAGTLALIVAAAQALGATPTQTVSWITAISLVKGLESGYLTCGTGCRSSPPGRRRVRR